MGCDTQIAGAKIAMQGLGQSSKALHLAAGNHTFLVEHDGVGVRMVLRGVGWAGALLMHLHVESPLRERCRSGQAGRPSARDDNERGHLVRFSAREHRS